MSRPAQAWPDLQSAVQGVAWPPILHPHAATLLALCQQLEASQWLPKLALEERQSLQLGGLLRFGAEHSAYVQGILKQAGLTADTAASMQGLSRLPVLTRGALQVASPQFFSERLPRSHLPISENKTSGSTGVPVVVRRTAISQLFWQAFVIQEHRWNQRDFSLRLAIIRAGNTQEAPALSSHWGAPVSLLWRSGPSAMLPISTDVEAQVQWPQKFNPGYLLTYPTYIATLVQVMQQSGIKLPGLRQIRTIGETLTPDTRETVRNGLGVDIVDTYSSQEVGIIAVQCPQSGLYHTMAENLIVEVLRDDGAACEVGESGRVVVTDLSNLATPLIRYDIGDFAERGPKCSCGRGLPTLKCIHGRQRNMVVFPDGKRNWPSVGFRKYRHIAPILQYQLVQTASCHIEVRLVVEKSLLGSEEQRLGVLICESLGYKFGLTIVYFDGEIPRGVNGKYEEFICAVTEHHPLQKSTS